MEKIINKTNPAKKTGADKPAILGGRPILAKPLPISNNIGKEEKAAVAKVLDSGILSDYIGRAGEKFLGGKEVKALEEDFKNKLKVKYAVSFNSATTALDAAVCALGIGPGDEVIVSPYTMSASATAILMNMAIPVFADIEKDTFCLDPESVESRITERTKAIMVVNIFGGSARYDRIIDIAKKYNLKIIEDNAQSPGGKYRGKYLGTIGDIGIFSLNFHKTIQSGEGGILVTNSKDYAFKAQLKRNHGEDVLDDLKDNDTFVLGSNYRMTEIHAAIAKEQLKKLDFLNQKRIELADYLTLKLKRFNFLTPAYVIPESKHVYYVYPIKFDSKKAGISRRLFAAAMEKEGFGFNSGYLKPIYLMPLFQNKKIFNKTNCPFDCKHYKGTVEYGNGICPTAEKFWNDEVLLTTICRHPLTKRDIDSFISAIEKIIAYIPELKRMER
jgi:perosamine synthetase